MQKEIYDALLTQARENATGSQLSEMPEHVGESSAVSQVVQLVESEDDEIASLI